MNRKYLVLTLGIAVLIGMLIGPETIKAQLFPEPVYVVNPNDIAAGVMGTSASPMVTTATITGSTTPADAYANPTTAIQAYSLGGIFNGTTWDRTRSASSASATTGTGLLGVGLLGKYNTAPPTFTNGQFGQLQIDAAGQLKTTGGGGGGTQYAEDAVHVSGDLGFQFLAVRNDSALTGSPTALTSATGDYSPVATDSAGAVVCASKLYGQEGVGGNFTPVQNAYGDNLAVAGVLAAGVVVYDTAGNWDRVTRIYPAADSMTAMNVGSNGLYKTSLPTLSHNQWDLMAVDNNAVMQTNEVSFVAATITTNATTVVKGTSPAWLKRIVVGVAGTTTTATLYNIASAGCTGTPASGLLGTFNTSVNWVIDLDMRFDAGVCIVTAGGTAANLQVVYK